MTSGGSNWVAHADLSGLRAVLDPRDVSGAKNDFIHQCHVRGLETTLQHLDPRGWTTSLDFGCGIGRLVPLLLRHSRSVVGVDVDSGYLARAREAHPVGAVRFVHPGDLPALPPPVLAVSVGVMAHLDGARVLKELRWLRDHAGDGASMVLAERVVPPGTARNADIEARTVDWYAQVLRRAGWRPVSMRVLRRSRSTPLRLTESLLPRTPRAMRRQAIRALASVEARSARRSVERGPFELCIGAYAA